MFGKNFSKDPTEKQRIGQLGEDFTCNHLQELGYMIVCRNYLKKWGEIDVVAKRGKRIHFIEVKTVSREIREGNVLHETKDSFRAEDNMHPWKLQRLGRVIQSYLLEKDIADSVDWQLDLATVYIDVLNKRHRVEILPDIVL